LVRELRVQLTGSCLAQGGAMNDEARFFAVKKPDDRLVVCQIEIVPIQGTDLPARRRL
jgi:hypothetical protein